MLAHLDARVGRYTVYTNSQPLVSLEVNSIPPWGYYFPLPSCGFRHTVPVFFQHRDGNKVGYTLFIQPDLQVSEIAFLPDFGSANIAISCHLATTFLDVLEVHLGDKV